MPNEIRTDMLKVKRMISEVEMIIGKREGETKLVNKLIDAENLLTYCMSRLENAVVPPCKVGDTVYIPWMYDGTKGIAFFEVTHIIIDRNKSYIKTNFTTDDEGFYELYNGGKFVFDKIGKTFFLTYEEAEQALKEGVDNG